MLLVKSLSLLKVHCRIGSLEDNDHTARKVLIVHCRIGSLEVSILQSFEGLVVHCRIGSLEEWTEQQCKDIYVHCRIGSLEVLFSVILMEARYSVSNSCNKKPIISEDNWLEQRVWLSDYSSIIPITRYYNQIVFM